MKNPQRAVILTLLAGSALSLASWTQVWFVFDASEAVGVSQVAVEGSEGQPLVSALAIGSMAAVGALLLAGGVMRYVILVISLILSVAGVWACGSAITEPASSSLTALSSVLGVDDLVAVSSSVVLRELTPWAWLTAVGFAVSCVASLLGLATSRFWRNPTSRYNRPSVSTISSSNVSDSENVDEAWDSLSRGEDPTR